MACQPMRPARAGRWLKRRCARGLQVLLRQGKIGFSLKAASPRLPGQTGADVMTVADELEKRSAVKKAATSAVSGSNGHSSPAEREAAISRLRMMLLIRRFEERTFYEYTSPRTLPDGTREMKIGGFCHLYSGQEAIAVGCAALFDKSHDYLINGYR